MRGTPMTADLKISSPHTAAGRDPDRHGRHLHPAALPQWHALLGLLWRDRLERVTALSLAYHDAEDAAGDVASDRGTRLAAHRQATGILHLAVTERRALAEIEAALNRLAAGGVVQPPRAGYGPSGGCGGAGQSAGRRRETDKPGDPGAEPLARVFLEEVT